MTALIAAGADPNATDNSGVGPLHRAVRTRCAARGRRAPGRRRRPLLPTKRGSTPLQLVGWTTGRVGNGSSEAKAQQAEILRLLSPPGTGTAAV